MKTGDKILYFHIPDHGIDTKSAITTTLSEAKKALRRLKKVTNHFVMAHIATVIVNKDCHETYRSLKYKSIKK